MIITNLEPWLSLMLKLIIVQIRLLVVKLFMKSSAMRSTLISQSNSYKSTYKTDKKALH